MGMDHPTGRIWLDLDGWMLEACWDNGRPDFGRGNGYLTSDSQPGVCVAVVRDWQVVKHNTAYDPAALSLVLAAMRSEVEGWDVVG